MRRFFLFHIDELYCWIIFDEPIFFCLFIVNIGHVRFLLWPLCDLSSTVYEKLLNAFMITNSSEEPNEEKLIIWRQLFSTSTIFNNFIFLLLLQLQNSFFFFIFVSFQYLFLYNTLISFYCCAQNSRLKEYQKKNALILFCSSCSMLIYSNALKKDFLQRMQLYFERGHISKYVFNNIRCIVNGIFHQEQYDNVTKGLH